MADHTVGPYNVAGGCFQERTQEYKRPVDKTQDKLIDRDGDTYCKAGGCSVWRQAVAQVWGALMKPERQGGQQEWVRANRRTTQLQNNNEDKNSEDSKA